MNDELQLKQIFVKNIDEKIDGVVALIMGLGNAIVDDNDRWAGFVESSDQTFFSW